GGRARLADGDDGGNVADDEVRDGDFIGAGVPDYIRDGFVDAKKALGDRRLGRRRDGAKVDGHVAVAVRATEAVAGAGEGGIDAEDGDGGADPLAGGIATDRVA